MFEFTTMAPVAKHEGENATTAPAAKRERKNVALTDRMCETRVTKRTKIYDRKCPGLFVSITTSGVATFYYKFTNPGTGRQSTGWLGVYNPETFDVDHARTKVYGLRGLARRPSSTPCDNRTCSKRGRAAPSTRSSRNASNT